MNIDEIRRKTPALIGLDDATVLDVIHQTYYSDMPKEALAQRLGYKPEVKTEDRSLLRTAGDYGISALKGAIGVPEAAVGLADMVTGGYAGKTLEEAGFRPKDAKAFLDQQYSDQQKEAFQNVQQAEGFGGKFVAALQNPSVIAHSVVESLAPMGVGVLAKRGVMALAPRVGRAIAAGAGEGIVGAGSAAEQIRQETPGGLLSGGQTGLAVMSGAATFALGALGNKVAESRGIADFDTMMLGVAKNPAAAKGIVRRLLEGAASEGILEELPQSISEQAIQNIALGKPIEEGIDQAAVMGLLSGAAMGGGANVFSGGNVEPMVQPPAQTPPPVTTPNAPIAQTVGTLPNKGALTRAANAIAPVATGPLTNAAKALTPEQADQIAMQLDKAAAEAGQGIPADVNPDTGEVGPSAYEVRQADAPKSEPGDILNAMNEPFKSQFSAKRIASQMGDGFQAFQIGPKQFVVRKVQPDVSTSTPIDPVDSGSGGQLGDNAAGSDSVRGRVPDNATEPGAQPAGEILGDGQQDAPVRVEQPKPAPPLTAPANLRDGLARIRAQRQEAADAQTAAQSAPTSAPAVSAAGTPAVQADGAKPSREVADAAGIATSVLGEDMAAKNRFADFADAHAGKPAGEVQSLLAASEFGPKLAGNELAQISDQISKSGSGVASQARANAAPQVEASDSQKLANKIKFQKIRVEQAGAAVASAQDVDQFGLPIENGPKKQAAKARLQKAEADLAALESTQPQGTPTNSPSPANPRTQASQTPSTQGAAPAVGDTSAPVGTAVATEPWKMTRKEYAQQGGDISYSSEGSGSHRGFVEAAVSRGETISPEVLKDYPWIAADQNIKPYADGLRNLSDNELRSEEKRATDALNKWANKTPTINKNGGKISINPQLHTVDSFEVSARFNAVNNEIERRKDNPNEAPTSGPITHEGKAAFGILPKVSGVSEVAAAEQPAVVVHNQGPHYAQGIIDFKAGKPRILPSSFTKPTNKNAKDWYRGWDSAQLAAPVASTSPEAVAAQGEGLNDHIRALRAEAQQPQERAPGQPVEEQNLQAAKNLLAQQKAATGNALAEGAIRKKLRDLAAKTPISDAKTVSALDIAATRLGMGEGKLKGLEFAPAAAPVSNTQTADAPELSESTKARNLLMELQAKQDANGMVGDDRLETQINQIKREIAKLDGQNDELDAEMQSYEAKPNPTYSGEPAVRQKLETIAQRLGFTVNKSKTGWRASGSMLSIPTEDADLSSAVSADHVFAHELGHGVMTKRGVSIKGFPDVELRKRVSNWDELVAASKAFRPGVHGHTSDSARKHAKKPNEIAADAIASVLIGDKPLSMLQPFMDWLGIDKVDLGLQTVEEANAESRAKSETKSPEAQTNIATAATETIATPDAKTALSEREKAAKAKMFNALGKLAALASKNTRMNWTQEEEQQLLPIVIELFDGAMDLGAVTFQKAVAYVREFIASGIDQETADAIPFETLQGAYISVSGRHKDKNPTNKKEVAGFDSLEELAAQTESADTSAKEPTTTADETPKESLLGANDDTRRNATNDSEPLDQTLQGPDAENGQRGNAETGAGLRPTDAQGNGRPESGGAGRRNSLDGSEKPVLPSTPAEIRPLADGPIGKTEDRPQQLSGENPGNFVITDDFKLGQGTDGDKISGNLNAIRTLREIQKENRYPTKAEQATMARYVGWGGLKTVFDPKKADATDQYGKAQRELKALLSPDEYRAANGSIRNAHYTAEGIVDGMWRVMRFMGFKGGRALEPTVGIGNFVGRMPADMAASTEWHASELDTTTGQLAAMLYPEANILASTGFQDAPFADGAFDISVGNPPFGAQTILDKSPNRKHLNGQKIHNYIIAKAGMHLRPGGVMSMVVTHRFLDTANPEARDVLAKDFRFLGAFRLPNDAFKKNAGTDVVTDVVFLQKLGAEEKRERDSSWLDVNGSITVDGQAIRVNRYYQDNPAHILGRSAMDGSMQRTGEAEYTVHSDGRDIGKSIDELMQTGFQHMAGVLDQSNSSKALAPAMLTQSDLPIGGVMVNDEGKIIRRELNDDDGNAVLQELTPETLWKDQAAEWQALQVAVLDVKNAAIAGKVTQDDANEVLALSRFLFKADGTPSDKPTKAVEAVYKLVEDLAKPEKFQWTHDSSLLLITAALNRKQLGEDGYQSLKGMLDLRNRTLRLIHAEQSGDVKMEEYRADLNKAYDAFVKENGYLSDPKNANLLEGDVGAEAGIEANYVPAVSPAVAKSSGTPARAASAKKSDIMARRVNFPYKEITHADSAPDALFASISEHGKVDLPYMAKITNKSVQSVIEELTSGDNPQLFRDPETGEYQEAERYLSGNVKHKLKLAKERGLQENIKALEKSLPKDKTKAQVKPNIRGMWMPQEIFTEFLQAIGYQDAKISVIASQGMLQASGEKLVMADFGVQFRHEKRTPMDMFNSQASGKPIIISYTSGGKTYKDEQGTKEVNALAERMGKVFQKWAYSDDDRVKRIVEAFNQNMNTHAPRTFDGVKYLKPVGASPSVVLRRTQLDGAWRMMQERTMLADHVVGAGKTFTLITGIMERRRMGLSRKPMVVVPNHLVTQWARDFYKLYPGAKVLAANPADFSKKNRRRLLARIATGDYDAVIVGHTSIGFMETPTEDLKAIVDEKLEGLKQALAEARLNNESKRTLGQIEDRIDRYEQRLKDLAARPTDDIGIDFKALGIDHLSVDEAHEFKNLEYSTSGDRVVGMNDPNGSKKAFDLYSKVRGLLARGGGVTFATGTPVSNSLVEIYTMMSYLAHDELVLRGQDHFDSWSGAYAATETRLEYTATQKLKPRRVLAGLNNLSALRQLYEQFADIITMANLKRIYTEEMVAKNQRDGTNLNTEFPVPKVANGKRELIAGDITPAQKEYMDYLVARMGKIEQNKSNKEYMRIDNALNVLTDARKMSLDIRIVDPGAQRDENGKVATAAKNIKATYDKWDADRGTQLVFCDLSTPAKTAAKEARSIISATVEQLFGKDLVKRAKQQLAGMPFEKQWAYLVEKAEEIADNPETSEEKRDSIAEYMSKIEDPEATMNVADIGFSVYDDLKTVLMNSGIPESEIAFIHDYNTPDQKEKLFDRVNNGYVRVLIGSSAKMGAGTNAQRRLVALHHMDAPWRPSDVEQREGRIIRQGNTFHTEFNEDGSKNPLFKPDFEVEIKAYSTNQTSDTVMWQILQRKAGAIEQFREGGLDSMEEEGGDSDQYAEFMATSTGNPVFRQKLEAERRLTEIESEIGGALIVRSNANSFLESYDRRRKAAKTRQEALETFDASTASYGGESGTQAEFEAAMKVANDDYLVKYATWTQKNASADLAIAKWETQPEDTRGDKPSKPTMPSQPDLYTKSVQTASGYARAIGMALNEAAIDKNTKVTMATGSIIVTGQTMMSGPYWTVYANNLGENFSLDSSGAQKPSGSPRLIQALMPFSLRNELSIKAKSYARDIVELDNGKTEALKGSILEVDTSERDAARVELRWFAAQVAFAEVQADIDRGASKNRYIERDKRRNISQNAAVALTEPVTHTIDGVKYTTTGLNANSGYQSVSQATRDRDGVPAFVVLQDKEKGIYAVAVQPAKLRKADGSTNLAQTGNPAANETDVVFSTGAPVAPGKGISLRAAKNIAEKVLNDLGIGSIVKLEVVRNPAEAGISVPSGVVPTGGTGNGKVHIFADNIADESECFRVIFHELFHLGLSQSVGTDQYNQAMLKFLSDPLVVKYAKEWKQSADGQSRKGKMPANNFEALAVEESLATIGELLNTDQKGLGSIQLKMWVRRAITALADFAQKIGLVSISKKLRAMTYTEAEKFIQSTILKAKTGAPVLLRDTRFSDNGSGTYERNPFYSALAKGIQNIGVNAAPAGGWKDAIKGLVNKGIAKADEVEWSGLNDWLDLQTGKVSKADVLDYLAANGVQVEEVTLGYASNTSEVDKARVDLDALGFDFYESGGIPYVASRESGDSFSYDAGYDAFIDENEDELDGEAAEHAMVLARAMEQDGLDVLTQNDGAPDSTRYSQYTLPGGENYREVLLTLPVKAKQNVLEARKTPYGYWEAWNHTTGESEQDGGEQEVKDYVAETSRNLAAPIATADYKSSHWDQANVLAHIRVNDRTDADGKRVLFVEEIQSDWGQQGKKDGFGGGNHKAGEKFTVMRNGDARSVTALKDTANSLTLVEDENGSRFNVGAGEGVPRAPFVTKTDAWLNLALKRIITMAVDGGYDRVAFVNGQQSADRYDLSKQIDHIDYRRNPRSDDTYDIAAVSKDGREVLNEEAAKLDYIEELVGKEIAQKIANGEGQQGGGRTTLRGLDLKVGGEGMITFYDRIVPNAVNALLKKVGGGKLEKISASTESKYPKSFSSEKQAEDWANKNLGNHDFTVRGLSESSGTFGVYDEYTNKMVPDDAMLNQPGFIITDALREKASEGLPLFQRGDDNQLAKAWQQVAQSPGIFRYKTSTAKTMEQVLASTTPDFIVENVGGDEDFADSWTVYAKDKDGNPDNTRKAHILLYKDGKVELNVYRLGEGNLGSELYAAVGNWAHNNGHVFAADRMGASPVGVQRRLENMISLALKFGSTDFIMPSNPKELGWIDGDTVHNLEQMLKASYADLVSKLPEIENASYDFASGRFSPDVTPELIQRARASGIQGGEGTIKRGIVTASLLRVLRSGEAIGPISRDGSSLNGIAYSKGDGLDAFRASLSKLSAPPATDPKVIAQVQAWTDELSAKWTNAPDIRVVASSADLPVPATSDTRGLYYRGTVYVVASRVGSKRAVGEVLAHESVAHYGLREMLGQTDWQRFMGNIQLAIKTGNKPLNAIRDQIRSVYVDENGNPNLTPEQEADEIAARVVEMAIDENGEFKPGFAFVKSVYAKIMQFLRDLGLNVKMTHLELQGALINAQRYLEIGNRSSGGGYPLMIAARGDAKAARNDQTQTPEFKRWFGDSVVTDNGKPMSDGGKPLVVYHGTVADVTEFSEQNIKRPYNGYGYHFATKPSVANHYADHKYLSNGNVMPVYLNIKNPFTGDFFEFKKENNFGLFEDYEATEALKQLGYDGIRYDDTKGMPKGKGGVNYVAFDPTQVKSATGNNGNFDPSNPDIRYARDGFDSAMASRSPIQSNTWNSPSTSKFDDIVYTLQNKQIDTKRVVDAIKQSGKNVAESVDVYLREELFHGRSAKRTEDFLNNELTPLLNDMKARGISLEQIDKYLHARHAEEANNLIASRNPDMPDGGSGMKTQEAKDYLNSLGAAERNRLDAVAKKIDGMIATTRQLYADEGLESQDTVDSWGTMFKHYVPLMREDKDGGMGIGQGFSIKGKESKGRVGSSRAVVDILANIAMQREKVIVRGEKNRVATALVGLATENPNPDFWTVGETPHEKVYDPKTNSVVDRIDPMYKSRENVVVAKVTDPDGSVKEVAVVFNEDNERAVRMAASLKNLDALQLNGLLGLSAKISRYISSINTQFNPIFGVVNLVRDVQGAMVNLSTTDLKGQEKEVSKHVLSALKGVYLDARAMREGKTASSTWAALHEEFQNLGGQTGYRDLFATSEDRAKALQSELTPYAWMDGTLGKVFTANGMLKVPMSVAQDKAKGLFDWLSDYNLAMENAVRLSAYKVGIDQGMTKERAASLAKNLTVNFNRKGQISQQAGALYAFFNAGVQGTARLSQVLFEMDGSDAKTIRLSATGKKVVAGGVMLGVAQAVMLAAAGFGDDDPPEFVRERNLIIPTGGKSYITIPMPLGLHVLPNVGRVSTEFAMGGFKEPTKRAAKLFGLFADAFNPMGGSSSLLQMLSPTPIDPLVAIAENKDGMGRTIAKTSRNPAVPGYTLAKDTASKPAKLIAEAINYLSGGTEYKAGLLSPTPDQVDFLIGQATGGVGRELSKIDQSARAMMTGEELPMHKIPLVGRFYGDSDLQSSQANAFYSAIKRIEEHELQIKGLRKDGKGEELSAYFAENPEAQLVPMANRVELQIQKLQTKKREMMKRDVDAEQIKAIENQIKERMKVFNMVVRNLREKQPA